MTHDDADSQVITLIGKIEFSDRTWGDLEFCIINATERKKWNIPHSIGSTLSWSGHRSVSVTRGDTD